jgi:hypothetical protein
MDRRQSCRAIGRAAAVLAIASFSGLLVRAVTLDPGAELRSTP